MNTVNIDQKRYLFGEGFTLSKLYLNGILFPGAPYVLEDKVREVDGVPVDQWKIPCETAIPYGKYIVTKTMSNRFGRMMYLLNDVPGFSGVRIHSGNTSHDTEGCLLPGKERDEKHGEVSGSRLAIAAIETVLDRAVARGDRIIWTVEGAKA